MTDLEVMQHAKIYMEKLANGIDPVTDREAAEDDVIQNVRLSRCFFYVADVLRRLIEIGGMPQGGNRKKPFALPLEKRDMYAFNSYPVTVSVITQQLNSLADNPAMQKLKTTSITGFLLQSGLLESRTNSRGKKERVPTEAGRELGIATETRIGQNGDYTAVLYHTDAQKLILDNLDAIIELNVMPRYENQNKPWTPEEELYLRESYRDGMEIKVMAEELKRSRGAIRARLKRLGLEEYTRSAL